jgi:hypothetical protein
MRFFSASVEDQASSAAGERFVMRLRLYYNARGSRQARRADAEARCPAGFNP